ncbi:flagellar motor protein MotA [Martelella soudanensis]|uniref:flagellar motor protein MotA n=1 Tax=unclassified Martelella TaxID=2629616 RepID=UPI0035304F49
MANMSDFELEHDDRRAPPRPGYALKMSSPMSFVWTMVIFLILIGFCVAILYRQAHTAFMTNPGLNGLILGVLLIGILMVFTQVLALRREVAWLNSFRAAGSADRVGRDPKLLAPMRALIGSRQTMALSTNSLRSILDSIATRLDEQRDTSRYLVGLLVFLGLLGTFWGLLNTIGSIGDIIQNLDPNAGDSSDVLDALKAGLAGPLSGMGTAFSSSLLGLSGSLVLGFLDLQAGRAQNRFYMELENWLSSVTDVTSDLAPALEGVASGSSEQFEIIAEELRRIAENGAGASSVPAMAQLAEGIQGVVKNMRNEQQMLRDWIEAQQEESQELRRTLQRLTDKLGDR